ncbi:hypothetical protein A3F28_01160 [Candidatus Uhrbacteria bacterium RIFCSPHIGHO2_12_FULL_57_11]|uniref:GtrA/DPMS transmembrane domain-containing protein n=2 Tax=Candidatus Uhriibacteriota TaxID=1752732 RepID=A0A1F7ULI9_9BACT|nr:MAG: hypothetical protein A3D72_00950 [Candidatus Uhrbacteria bacterium RIFCSPHIGHO2_02_FULL_57_19]OGL79146.1 MAG: hypothetical protein A3F28_01160 [Candidatus Uhrbacteria bacterium RIFCSPHIGHO2_12_FULL_57_11]
MSFLLSLLASPIVGQMVRYALVGLSTTVIDFGVYIGLTRGFSYFALHFLLANAIAFVCDITWNFHWNRKWTFGIRAPGVGYQYASFFVVASLGLLWNQLLLAEFVRGLHLYDLIAKMLAISIVFFWNFSMQRLVTFRLVPSLVNRLRK